MIPRTVHQTAPSHCLSMEEKRLQTNLKRHLSGWEFRLWNDEENDRLFCTEYPQYAECWSRIRSGVLKADIARCLYLKVYGGWYLDTDYCLLKPIPNEFMQASCVLPISGEQQDLHFVCNSVMASVPGFPLWGEFIEFLFEYHELDTVQEEAVEATSGPYGLSKYLLGRKSDYPEVLHLEKPIFHPRVTVMGFHYEATEKTCGVHWCWGSWKSKRGIRRYKNRLVRLWTSWIYAYPFSS